MPRRRSSKAAAAGHAVSVFPWNPPPLIIRPSRVPGMNFTALFCSRPRINPATFTLIGVSWSRRFTWVAVRCRSFNARRLRLSAWYSRSDRRGAGMKVSRVKRHCCHPSHVVRSGGGPARRKGTSGLSSPGGRSTILFPLLLVVGKEEHVAFPEARPQPGRRFRSDGDSLFPSAAPFTIDAVVGLLGSLGPAQWSHVRPVCGVRNGFRRVGQRCRPAGLGGLGLGDLAGVLGALRLVHLGRPLADRDLRSDQLQQDREELAAGF